MPAPTNINAATAVELGPLPNSISQRVDFSGTTYTVWYKYTATFTGVVGIWAFGDFVVYQPTNEILESDGVTDYLGGFFALNVPTQMPVVNGQVYYFEIEPNSGNPSPANLTISGRAAPTLSSASGDILINDDTDFFPAAILSPTDGTVRKFLPGFPAGEAGDVFSNGSRMLFVDSNTAQYALFDQNFNLLTEVGSAPSGAIISTNKTSTFYIGNPGIGGQASVTTLSGSGVPGLTTFTFASAGLTGMAPSPDETILYYTGQNAEANAAVKRWDLVHNTGLTDLVAGLGSGYGTTDIIALTDATILVLYYGTTTRIIHYNASGSILNTYDFSTINVGTRPRICRGIDDPNSFWLFAHLVTGIDRFINVKVSDGSTIVTFDEPEYESGVYQPAATASPLAFFGHSASCPIMIIPAGVTNTGSISVVKLAVSSPDPTTIFTVLTGGGLYPPSFTLTGGQTQEFLGVPVGSDYQIVEEALPGWLTTYQISPGGGTSGGVVVTTGVTTTVTITNVYTGPFSGIYFIHPGKTNDTLYSLITPIGGTTPPMVETTVVAIPNPFIVL